MKEAAKKEESNKYDDVVRRHLQRVFIPAEIVGEIP